MTQLELMQTESLLRWTAKQPQTAKVIERRKDLITSYRRHLLANSDTFEAMVVKTLITER